MKQYLNCKKIETAIIRAKKSLIEKAKIGMYECFGSVETSEISDVFIDTSDYSEKMNLNRAKLRQFQNWAESYTWNIEY